MDARCDPSENLDIKSVKSLKVRDHKNLSDAERIEKLEKEVTTLRNDFDRVKWEQAVTETAIGRAIIRGSASLNEAYGLVGKPPKRNQQIENISAQKMPMVTGSDKKTKDSNKKVKDECGGFTLG
ncbi:hypothetical protein HCN44_000051 [Aphidius gifuensis]|uniref:Uncharacterized protein n=1 Tax=Aphidius gifuensis TaxID=684658 RepID=A0A834XQE7_APHGI|nr:uncharacterized protein LOC122855383 [Aphidius gifuensis]KAF7990246.1 hypothetical protein HCN44_000051 [Aphidius gifuensis]